MDITVTSSDQSTEVFTKGKAKEPEVKEEKPVIEAVDDVTEDDSDDGEGELSERAKKIIARKERAIDKKHRGLKEAEEMARDQFNERKSAEKRAEDLAAELAALKSQAAKAPEKTREDFKTDEEWIDYRAELRIEAKEKARLEAKLKSEHEQLNRARIERNEVFAAEHPDFQEVIFNGLGGDKFVIKPEVEQFFYESDQSAAVLYYLGQHPEEYASIAKMKPTRAIKALGLLEDKLTTPAKAETKVADPAKTLSRAPAPITPIADSSSPTKRDATALAEAGKTDEFLALMREKRRAKLRH